MLTEAYQQPLGMKEVGNDRENTLTTFIFIFLFGNGYGNRRARSGKRNRMHGKSKQFDWKHVDNGRGAVFKSGNIKRVTTSNVELNAIYSTIYIHNI